MILVPRYRTGRRFTLGATVRIGETLQAHVEAEDLLTERTGLTFDDLPREVREGISRGAQRAMSGAPLPGESFGSGSPATTSPPAGKP